MKRKTLILCIWIFIMITIIMGNNHFSYGKASTNDPTVESGGTVKITVSTSTAVSCFKIELSDAGGLTFQSVVRNSIFVGSTNGTTINGASSESSSTTLATYTFKVPEVSETKKYSVKFYVYNMDTETDTTTTSTVTVKAKETPKPPDGGNTGNNQGGNNGGTTSKPPVTEPKFTSVSKTVYATGDINLRSSWSTSSSATKVGKGTELKLTGTSTEKVNGYVWYRVTYNGQIKYVVNNLVTEKKPEEKSNNTNLKTLSIENVELSPVFSADVLQYTGKINGYEEKEIKVIAEAEDTKSTVKVEGNTNIVVGENIITAEVTAEDGTKKTYKIILTNEKETTSLGLQSLKIKDVELKGFSPDKFEYEVSFRDLEKLEIEAIANQEGAIIEISGNENLNEDGEHLITIMVSSADGTQTVNYQIKANKLKQEAQNIENKLNIKNIIIYGAIALLILALIILLIVKYVKRK